MVNRLWSYMSNRYVTTAVITFYSLTVLLLSSRLMSNYPLDDRLQIAPFFTLAVIGFMVAILHGMAYEVPFNKQLEKALNWLDLAPLQLAALCFAPIFAWLASMAAGTLYLAHNPWVAHTSWIMSTFLLLTIAYQKASPSSAYSENTKRSNILELLGVAAIFAAAILLRITFLDQFPNTVSGDEGSSGLMAVRFLNGEANNVLGLGWFSFPAFYFWVQSIGIWAWGQTVEGLRLMSGIAGALTVVAVYWFVRHTEDRLTAFIAAALLTAAHYHIHFSRIGLNNIWDGLFAILVLATAWRGWQTGRRSWFVLCGLFLGISQYFYVSMRVFPLVILIWALVGALYDFSTFRQRFLHFVAAAYISFIIFMPLGLYFLDNPDEFNAPMQRVTIFDGWLENEQAVQDLPAWRVIADQMWKSATGITHRPLRNWYTPGTGMLLIPEAIAFVAGLLYLIIQRKLQSWLYLIPITSVVMLGVLSTDVPAAQRYIIVSPLAIIIAAIPLGAGAQYLASRWFVYRHIFYLATAVIVLGIMWNNVNFYFNEVYDEFLLGGVNTEVATRLAYSLQNSQLSPEMIYFVGAPRMTYDSHSTVPYLVPEQRFRNLNDPIVEPPNWKLPGVSVFVILPERAHEADHILQAYPNGQLQMFNSPRGYTLFLTIVVEPE